jgi:hypothetical protein
MTTAIAQATDPTTNAEARRLFQGSVWRVGLTAGAVGATATVATAAAARGLAVSLKVTGSAGHSPQPIPPGGFAA